MRIALKKIRTSAAWLGKNLRLLVRKAPLLVCFDIVRDLEGLDVSDDIFGWFDEVASGRSVSLDALALC